MGGEEGGERGGEMRFKGPSPPPSPSPLVKPQRPSLGPADRDGVALRRARKRKEATYPELIRAGARALLVDLGQ